MSRSSLACALALSCCVLQGCFERNAPRSPTIYVPAATTYPAYVSAYTPPYDGFRPAAGLAPLTPQPRRTACTNLGEAASCTSW